MWTQDAKEWYARAVYVDNCCHVGLSAEAQQITQQQFDYSWWGRWEVPYVRLFYVSLQKKWKSKCIYLIYIYTFSFSFSECQKVNFLTWFKVSNEWQNIQLIPNFAFLVFGGLWSRISSLYFAERFCLTFNFVVGVTLIFKRNQICFFVYSLCVHRHQM
jgi:hypothetical protein